MRRVRHIGLVAIVALLMASTACDDDEPQSTIDAQQLLTALLTIDDLSFIPAEWDENMRTFVEAPVPPFDGTLDPYLCTEVALPAAFTMPQAQLELTGGGALEVLLNTAETSTVYDELIAAYTACGPTSSLPYSALEGVPDVGDASRSFQSSLGFLTIARQGDVVMILRWMVGDYADEGFEYYPQMVTTAVGKLPTG